jgi:hypothetical protein
VCETQDSKRSSTGTVLVLVAFLDLDLDLDFDAIAFQDEGEVANQSRGDWREERSVVDLYENKKLLVVGVVE